jgi:ATP synthase protein I
MINSQGSNKQAGAQSTTPSEEMVFLAQVGAKAARKQRAQRDGDQGVWFGLGMSGLIGWSVAIPTLLGVLLGVWLDERHPVSLSWTLTLLFAGLILGCFNAWHWVSQQNDAIRDQSEEDTHG